MMKVIGWVLFAIAFTTGVIYLIFAAFFGFDSSLWPDYLRVLGSTLSLTISLILTVTIVFMHYPFKRE